jgi:hypothetical protein
MKTIGEILADYARTWRPNISHAVAYEAMQKMRLAGCPIAKSIRAVLESTPMPLNHVYKAGDKVRIVSDKDRLGLRRFFPEGPRQFAIGDILTLVNDDGTNSPVYILGSSRAVHLCFAAEGLTGYARILASWVEPYSVEGDSVRRCTCEMGVLMSVGCRCGGV